MAETPKKDEPLEPCDQSKGEVPSEKYRGKYPAPPESK
jgi:hypothetical protein